MSEEFARDILKVAMAQICQNLGWHAVQTAPMNILVEILQRYLTTLARIAHQYAEHYNRVEPNLNDLGLAFKELGISLSELEEYVNNVEPVPFVHPIPQFPVAHDSQFNFPKENCREVNLRPEWIHSHLPRIYPEDEEAPLSPADVSVSKSVQDSAYPNSEAASPSTSPRPTSRRPLEIAQDGNFTPTKRHRLLSDEDGRPMREVISVSMTPAGLISPYREGRLPDTCTPLKGFEDSRPSSPVISEEAEDSLPPSASVVEPPAVLSPVIPPEIVKPKKPKIKDGTKLKHKIKKDNKENKKKELKESKSKKKEALKAQLKAKDKLTKLAKAKLKSYKLPKVPKLAKLPKVPKIAKISKVPKIAKLPKPPKLPGSLDSSKYKKTGRPKKPKISSRVMSKTIHQSDLPDMTPGELKLTKHSSKLPKAHKTGKSPKSEKMIAGGQLASLLTKASSSSNIKVERFSPEFPKLFDPYSRGDSLSRPVSSINTVPPINYDDQRSNESFPPAVPQRVTEDIDHNDNSNDSSNIPSDSEEIPSFRSKIKLEPKDVYDFTDDEDNRNATVSEESRDRKVDTLPSTPLMSPTDLPSDMIKSGLTSPDKPKRKRGRPPKYPKKELDFIMGGGSAGGGSVPSTPRPRTPEYFERSPPMPQQKSPFSSMSSFGMSQMAPQMNTSYYPLANIPPALLPFPISFSSPSSQPSMNVSGPVPSSSGMTPYPKLAALADVAISKAQHDGDFDLGRSKEKDKTKRKGKRDKKDKDKDKIKIKKKKDKSKDKKDSEKLSSSGKSEKNRDKNKTKKGDGSGKSKEKKEKSDKNKEKKKSKDKEKKLEKKKDKGIKLEKDDFREEKELERSSSPAAGVAFPRLTFKLGTGTDSESPKIVIKGLSNTDSPSSSPLPYVSERSPPDSPLLRPPPPLMPRPVPGISSVPVTSSHGKSHPKAPPPKAPPQTPSATARTVITETVGTIIDASGNKIWICPACTHPDDGSPMIGCDDCDEWYHWVCVGIEVPPKEDENWFCSRCIAKQQTLLKKRRYRKDN